MVDSSQQQQQDTSVLCQPAREFLPMIEEVRGLLAEKVAAIPGAMVEDNKFCLSVHFRCVDEKVTTATVGVGFSQACLPRAN